MIRALRPSAITTLPIAGWNIALTTTATVVIGPSAGGYSLTIVAGSNTWVGAAGPTGEVIFAGATPPPRLDADVPWWVRINTASVSSYVSGQVSPPVDLPDIVHPVYSDDALAIAAASAAIDGGTHVIDDYEIEFPAGLTVAPGMVVAEPGGAVGQVEDIAWRATPAYTEATATVRTYTAMTAG